MAVAKMEADVALPLVEAMDEVEYDRAVSDRLAKVVCYPLEAHAVVGDGVVTLGEAPKLGVEVERPGLPIVEELRFQGNPGGMSSGTP